MSFYAVYPPEDTGAGGDVVGPSSTTNDAVARFDGTTGKLIQNSVVIIDDTGNTSGIANLNVSGTTTLATSLSGVVRATAGVISATPAANLTAAGTDGIAVTGGTAAVLATASIAQHVADTTHNGYLSSTDWNTFNGKQAPGNYITALTGDVTATGPGSVAATLATVNSNTGAFGSSTAIPSFTVNGKGLITAASTSVVIAPAGTLTGTVLAANVVTTSLTSVGTIATGVWQATNIALNKGGTNAALTAVQGGLVWSDTSALAITAAGTAQQWVLSGGTAAPTMSNTTTTAKTIDGSADAVQLQVEGNSTQTSDILNVRKSDGTTSLLQVTNVNGTKIRGTTTNDDAAAGFVGEFISNINTGSANNMPATGTFGGDQDITLTAGDWDISFVVYITQGSATVTVSPDMFVGTATGNNTTGRLLGSNYVTTAGLTGTGPGGTWSAALPAWRVSISSTTTYYLKLRCTYTVAAPTYNHRISARRIR